MTNSALFAWSIDFDGPAIGIMNPADIRILSRSCETRRMDGVKLILGPPQLISRVMWVICGLMVLYLVWAGPSVARFFNPVGIGMIAFAWQRYIGRRGVWLTDDEVVIANSSETHIVPKAGAAAAIIDEQHRSYLARPKPKWDNTVPAVRRLYVIPADPNRERVPVEAAEGIMPKQLARVADELDSAFKEAS